MGKHFRATAKTRRDENHRKCDNKNEIYELRLVIYLCANLLLQKERGMVRHYYVNSRMEKLFSKIFSMFRDDKLSNGRG